MFKQK